MSEAYRFNPTILREYDVRGQIGKTLSEADARALGRAYGTWAKRQGGKAIAIGYDGRHSSPGLAAALSEGRDAAPGSPGRCAPRTPGTPRSQP